LRVAELLRALGWVPVALFPGPRSLLSAGGVRVREPGIDLAVALAVRPPLFVAVAATALFALFHGVAHGLELPDMSSPWAYAIGFVGATAVLHAAGYAVVRFLPAAAAPLVRVAGAASAATGVWLLAA
jgi:urease accessory protein